MSSIRKPHAPKCPRTNGSYFHLYPEILRLHERTGELIDGQKDAFFSGQALDALEEFLVSASKSVSSQPERWQQRVGRTWPAKEPVFESTSRSETLDMLNKVIGAVALARQRQTGLLFYGE